MDYKDAEHEEGGWCSCCRQTFEPKHIHPVCVDCVFDIEQDAKDVRRFWFELRDLLERSHGFKPSVVLLMAIAWLAVTLMESLP